MYFFLFNIKVSYRSNKRINLKYSCAKTLQSEILLFTLSAKLGSSPNQLLQILIDTLSNQSNFLFSRKGRGYSRSVKAEGWVVLFLANFTQSVSGSLQTDFGKVSALVSPTHPALPWPPARS